MLTVIISSCQKKNTIRLGELDLSKIEQGWNTVHINTNLSDSTLSVNGMKYAEGICTHAISEIEIILNKNTTRFTALVGVDDKVAKVNGGSIVFIVKTDGKEVFNSGIMRSNESAKAIDIYLKGVQKIILITSDGGDGTHHDHGNWLEAKFEYTGAIKPSVYYYGGEDKFILTPKVSEIPRINGAKITAARPGNPFLFRVPVTGLKPITVTAENLPSGLVLNEKTGIISGKVSKAGAYIVKLKAKNSKGECIRNLKIVIGNKLALTPPMGWNSWNVWGLSINEDRVKAAADYLESTGLADHGWTYINIDDGWEADARDANGILTYNSKFKDMQKMADYIHSKGLKFGIYTSPGELTCGKFLGSFNYEENDARTWAAWGVDYLKYDWCSYGEKAKNQSLAEYQKPYITMNNALKNVNRDIVYSMCQYGMGNVWKWGSEVGGHLWRTTGDITDTWLSLWSIGFDQQDTLAKYAAPGAWNDPDMLVVGKLGWSNNIRDSRLTTNEQYSHITLWSLLSAPLLIGCDLTQMDEFTLNLLSNDEVIEVNQDVLGKQASPIYTSGDIKILMKELEDGSKAVGLFNLGRDTINVNFDLKLAGFGNKVKLHDVWRQSDKGIYESVYTTRIPRHGCEFLRITKPE